MTKELKIMDLPKNKRQIIILAGISTGLILCSAMIFMGFRNVDILKWCFLFVGISGFFISALQYE